MVVVVSMGWRYIYNGFPAQTGSLSSVRNSPAGKVVSGKFKVGIMITIVVGVPATTGRYQHGDRAVQTFERVRDGL